MYAPHKVNAPGQPAAYAVERSTAAGHTPTCTPFARHDLVWLSAEGWTDVRARAAQDDLEALTRWQQNDWPAIVRRRDADLPPVPLHGQADHVCLGIPLPPDPASGIKRRIALRAPGHTIARSAPPRALSTCVDAAGPWQPELATFCDQAAQLGLRAFGSLAMQAITGLPCFTPTSDIDLLFAPRSVDQLDKGLELLTRFATRLPLDGEIVFPDGGAVAWKEWLTARATHSRVLVKSMTQVHLAAPQDLLCQLEPQ